MKAGMLKTLDHAVGLRLDEGFLSGSTVLEVEGLDNEFGRVVPTKHLTEVLREAMRRFDYGGLEERDAERRRAQADAWAAPRVHASLRLTRREAADRGLWRYVGVVVAPDFVRWRFPGKDGRSPAVRFIGPEYKHAVGRLWWAGELMRHGSDYSNVHVAFEVQDIADNWLRWDMAHNRAVTQACLRYLSSYDGGELATGRDAIKVGKALNRAATTINLDALAPVSVSDSGAYQRWQEADVNEQDWFGEELPKGPDDGEPDEESIEAVTQLLSKLAPPKVSSD